MRDFAYASYGDVQAHLSFVATFTATSRPNATQVHQHLIDASDELDTVLRIADYSTPIPSTATAVLNVVRGWTSIGAAAHTAYAMPQGTDSKHAQALEKRWQALLKDVREGDRQLDYGRDTRRSRPRFGRSTATNRFPVDEPR